MPSRPVPEKFLVAFSLAGEQRQVVRPIAEAVEARLGRGTVFYDDWFAHWIAGPDADTLLQEIYGQKAKLVVGCVSANYGDKPWPLAEYRAIRAREMQLLASKDKRERSRILWLRTGEGDFDGILFNTICPDVREKPVAKMAELIIDRLRLILPGAGRRVYLAECTAEMEDPRDRMKAALEDLGWTVLPDGVYPVDQYQSAIEKDLKQSLAFVQLIGPEPSKQGGFDRIQNEAAADLPIPRFRYRSSEIDLAKVDAKQRKFLTAPDVIAAGFEDFKAHLLKKLAVLAQRRDAASDEAVDENRPQVAVAIRSSNPEPLWEQVFQWIYDQEKIDPYQLRPGETFQDKHRAEPCQGFVVVCDAASLEDGPYSPRDDMEQCRVIQMKEKNPARRPPVALVYWPPPPVAWARLLRSTPRPLHCIPGNAPANLGQFFADVRKVAQ